MVEKDATPLFAIWMYQIVAFYGGQIIQVGENLLTDDGNGAVTMHLPVKFSPGLEWSIMPSILLQTYVTGFFKSILKHQSRTDGN